LPAGLLALAGVAACGGLVATERTDDVSESSPDAAATVAPDAGLVVDAAARDSDKEPSLTEYTAYDLYTDVPRMLLFKRDKQNDICVRVWLEPASTQPLPPLLSAPPPWEVRRAEVSGKASDCSFSDGHPTPTARSYEVVRGSGAIVFTRFEDAGAEPCSLDVRGELTIPGPPPNIPRVVSLDASDVVIGGHCGHRLIQCGFDVCPEWTSFCRSTVGGQPLPDGGIAISHECVWFPTSCSSRPDCPCIAATCGGASAGASCSESNGQFRLTCQAP
jgi:hypothetical protein